MYKLNLKEALFALRKDPYEDNTVLIEFKRATGLTPAEIANLLGVSKTFVNYVLAGRRKLPKKLKERIQNTNFLSSYTEYKVFTNSLLNKMIRLIVNSEEKLDNSLYDFLKNTLE